MLDLQRQRSGYKNKESVFFTRGLMITHLVIGASVAAALMFQEFFTLALLATVWYVVSAIILTGMAFRYQWCRVLLGFWFIFGAIGAMIYLVWYLPVNITDDPDAQPRLALRIMPIWVSTIALIYGFGGVVILISRRIQRATMRGFALWDAPRV